MNRRSLLAKLRVLPAIALLSAIVKPTAVHGSERLPTQSTIQSPVAEAKSIAINPAMAKQLRRRYIDMKVAQDKILSALASGHSRDIAAAAGHITPRRFREWLANEYFAQAVFEAEMENKRFHIANIHRAAAAGMWTPSAWLLEHKSIVDYQRIDHLAPLIVAQISNARSIRPDVVI